MMQLVLAAAVLPLAIAARSTIRRSRERTRRSRENEALRRQRSSDDEVIATIRSSGFGAAVALGEEDIRHELGPSDHKQERASTLVEGLEERKAALESQVTGGRSVVWTLCGGLIFSFIWFSQFHNLVSLDRELFIALGYDAFLVEPMSRLLAVSISVIGLILGDLIGVTRIIPGVGRLSRVWRWVLVFYVALAFAFGVSQLPRLMEHRSAALEGRVAELEAARVALETEGDADPAAIALLDGEIELQRSTLEAARFADRRLIVAVSVVEALTSWSLAILFGLSGVLLMAVRVRMAKARVDALEARRNELVQGMYSRLMRLGLRAGVPLEEIRRVLAARVRSDDGPPTPSPPLPEPPSPAPGGVPDPELADLDLPEPTDGQDRERPPADADRPWTEI